MAKGVCGTEIAATGAHEIAATGAHEIAATGAHEIAATGVLAGFISPPTRTSTPFTWPILASFWPSVRLV